MAKRTAKKSTKGVHQNSTKSAKTAADKKSQKSLWLQLAILSFFLPIIVTSVALWWKPSHFIWRLFLCLVLDSVYGVAIGTLIQPVASYVAEKYLAGNSNNNGVHSSNDPTIPWPNAPLPNGWVEMAKTRHDRKDDEPLFFLNHVRGSIRFQQSMIRIASGWGTLLMIFVQSHWLSSPPEPLSRIGLLPVSWIDFGWGFLIGSGVIIGFFLVEVAMGWIHIIGYFQVADPDESLILNLIWDILFHLGVSMNEEVSLRGWILVHSTVFLHTNMEMSVANAMTIAIGLQALWFASMHAGSSGASRLGLVNLVVGGTVAAANVVVSGSLWFPLGWHFGWNIWMGHFLGLSTSGIPMNAKIVNIVPHPQKAHWHGGRFGPEQSPLASIVYLVGLGLLLWHYGMEQGIQQWTKTLSEFQN